MRLSPGYLALISWSRRPTDLTHILSNAGAAKLIDAEPLSKMVPVDEYLPIMYDRHPNSFWKLFFQQPEHQGVERGAPAGLPTRLHYVGMEGYFSDTESTTSSPAARANQTRKCAKDEL